MSGGRRRGRIGKRSITTYVFRLGWKSPYTGDMQKEISAFLNEENGQDMVEYSLLIGFVALSGAAVLTGIRDQVAGIWHAISMSFVTASAS